MSTDGQQGPTLASEWFVVALFCVGLFGHLLPATAYFTSVPGDLGDSRFNSVVLEHLFGLVTGGQTSLWSPGFFYPFPYVLAFSDNLLGSGIVYVVGRLAGLSREHAVDLWYVVGGASNFIAAQYALRKLRISSVGVAIGAFLFAFALPAEAQVMHLQLNYRFGVPLAAAAFISALDRRSLVGLWPMALWTTWEFYCSIYLGIFLVYLLLGLTVAHILVRRPLGLGEWRRNFRMESGGQKALLAGVAIGALALVGYLLWSYGQVSRYYGFGRSLEEIGTMLPRPLSYLLADRVPLVGAAGRGLEVPMRHEHQLFVGIGTLLLLVCGVVAMVQRTEATLVGDRFLIALLLLIVSTLWIGGMSLYFAVASVPGLNSIRSVTRIVLVMLLPIAVLVGLGADWLIQRFGRRRWLAGAAGAVLVVAEPLSFHHYSNSIAEWQARTAALKAKVPPILPAGAVLMVRSQLGNYTRGVTTDLDAMIVAQDLNLPTVNGYSGNRPPGYSGPGLCVDPETLTAAYSKLTGMDDTDLLRRLVIIDASPCDARVPSP